MPFRYKDAIKIHDNKYDYSLVEFVNVDTKVTIICPIHGEFQQDAYHHISRKQGCGQCKGARISETCRMSLKEFVTRANLIHDNKYDYSKSDYRRSHTHVTIICPNHGEFSQSPNNHLYNKNGCPSCGYNTSKSANKWLDSLSVPQTDREKVIFIDDQKYKVDALHENTIYEYFGRFWHGCPSKFKPNDINPRNKTKFGDLHQKTLDRIDAFNNSKYDLEYKWGD